VNDFFFSLAMLFPKEYEDIVWKLDNIPPEITGKARRNLTKVFRKKIKEHQYASILPPFVPLPYIPHFIHRKKSEQTLHRLIHVANRTNEFTLDTESINVHKVGNKPVLIQLQFLSEHAPSFVLIVEICHLHRVSHPGFDLLRNLFEIIFTWEKTIYNRDTKVELVPFTQFGLFTQEQSENLTPMNLQYEFKFFWDQKHPHQSNHSIFTDDSTNLCICESCLAKQPSEL